MSEKNENKQKDVGVCPFKNILGFFVPPGSYWKTNCAEITERSWCLILGIKLVCIYKFTQSRWKWYNPDTNMSTWRLIEHHKSCIKILATNVW